MEYASEMVVTAELYNLKIIEVPTTLKKDGRSRLPHLRSFRDGWRHLKFLFMYAPKWLFLFLGLGMIILSIIVGTILLVKQLTVGNITFSIHTLLFCAAFLMIGVNILLLFIMTKVYAAYNNFLPDDKSCWAKNLNEDIFILSGGTYFHWYWFKHNSLFLME